MCEISMKINCLCCERDEFIKYICLLDGVLDCDVNLDSEEIYVMYDNDMISLKMVKMEILLFLGLIDIPSIDGFNKYLDKDFCEYILIIKDLCCEYCLRGMIDELLIVDGIGIVNHNYDNICNKDVRINIYYDRDVISEDKIVVLDKKFNLG